MLADECPRRTCYGVPLVRPPNAGREKDPRKECVVCGTVYPAAIEKKPQELDPLALGTPSGSRQEQIIASRATVDGLSSTAKGKEKAFESHAVPAVVASVLPAAGTSKVTHATASAFPATSSLAWESNLHLPTSSGHAFSEPAPVSGDILTGSRKALGATLSALSQRLLLLSSQPILDPATISQMADAIARTGQALAVINTLRHNQE